MGQGHWIVGLNRHKRKASNKLCEKKSSQI